MIVKSLCFLRKHGALRRILESLIQTARVNKKK